MEIQFYAADLAAYNNGVLHGVWVDASSDKDEMQQAISEMLRKSPCPNVKVEHPETGELVDSAEEWVVHDYDDDVRLISDMDETSDLGEIADRMAGFEEIEHDYDDSVLPHLIEWLSEACADPGDWKTKLDDAFAGIWTDAEDYAADFCESCGYLSEMPEALRNYVDFRALARDMALGGEMDFVCLFTKRHLQNYDDMRGREVLAMRNL